MRFAFLLAGLIFAGAAFAADGNRLVYLDENDPYYVSRTFPKLTTPQWVGEEGVEAVIVLAVDDMREPLRYEAFLRPILERLKKIDGRAPVSIMTNRIDPTLPALQGWLKEGLSIEIHTIDHPCPLLAGGDFAKAKSTYDRCVELMSAIPGNKPVAFRMPCCDSLNTPSPRFWEEIFNKTTEHGRFLTMDSSVFNIITPNDPALPRQLVIDADGRQKFKKYVPFESFVNTIEDYPYPYVISRLCWEMPCMTPSDWQAQYLNKPNSPTTVADMKAAIDATVIKQGMFNFVFHPHGWIRNDQVVELIDHAVAKHGKKVKFLTFKEAQERIDKNFLGGQPIRREDGRDNGVRVLDLNGDGFMDVVIGNEKVRQTRVWSPKTSSWVVSEFPCAIDDLTRFGIVDGVVVLARAGAWRFDGNKWIEEAGLGKIDHAGTRLRDLDGDGVCELITARGIFKSDRQLPFTLPAGTRIVDDQGRDAGLRFVDVDEDGFDDVLFSDEKGSSLHLFVSMEKGWEKQVEAGPLPPFVRNGTSNGAWFHSRHLWVQNEDTATLPNLVDRRSFNDLLATVDPGPKTPQASLKAIRVRPGFEVQLVAAEPLIMDPVAFNWDADGKLWVVEMGDYPLGVGPKNQPGGRVRFLVDENGDGVYDKSTLFLDGLNYPTGVLPWAKGVLITSAPDILYAEDTDGDGKADQRRILYTGLTRGNPQHLVNGLVLGLDNWVYCANGDSGGRVKSTKTGDTINISGRDFRIDPDRGLIDAETGQTQFGRNRDDWGNWFGCNNPQPMYHFVLSDRYLRRNPHVVPPRVVNNVPKIPSVAPVFPISRTVERFNDPHTLNRFTSANSVMIYRDDLFGPHFAGNMFVSEPVHNLVHREIVTPVGVSFTSDRAADEQKSEFLASSDNWFRPTMLRTGPDGALWIADMYRHVIEHPEWIPRGTKANLDLRRGSDMGRIYRVYPVGAKPRPIPQLRKLDTPGLIAALDSPNGWQRDHAQRLLLENADATAIGLLREMALKNPRPLARLHALCTLDGMSAADAQTLTQALADVQPGVRRHAVRIAEKHFDRIPAVAAAAAKLANDPDRQVRLQLACSLGEWNSSEAGLPLGQLALRDSADKYLLAAVFSSVDQKNLREVTNAVLPANAPLLPQPAILEPLLRLAAVYSDRRLLADLLSDITGRATGGGKVGPAELDAMNVLLDALDASNLSLARLFQENDQRLKASVARSEAIFEVARTLVGQTRAAAQDRIAAVRLLGRGPDKRAADAAQLAALLVPQTPQEVQSAAIASLARMRQEDVPTALLRPWKGYSLTLRNQVIDVLLGRNEWVSEIVDALEKGRVMPADIDAARRQRLLQHGSAIVRGRAEKIFADAINPDRQKVLDLYAGAVTLNGDAKHGAEVFTKTCATCHKVGEIGQNIGPDIAGIADKSPQSLLIAIVDPNRAVEAKYTNFVAETKGDDVATGIISSETGTSLTLISADGKPQTILRDNLKSLRSTGTSLMPENLENGYTPQDLADLIAFVRATNPPRRKTFDGNKPGLVRADAHKTVRLTPANCEIYGNSVVLEKQYGNLGYWSSEDDQAVWTMEITTAAKYGIWLEWACVAESAGNSFVLEIGPHRIGGRIASTGNWDTYHRTEIGELELKPGKYQVNFHSAGKISGALLDLKSIELVPPMERDF